MNDYATPALADRIVAILAKPPRDWLGASALADALGLPHRDALLALRELASLGAIDRDIYDDGELVEGWRLAR
jgi:hypothetical protein